MHREFCGLRLILELCEKLLFMYATLDRTATDYTYALAFVYTQPATDMRY